MDFRLNTNEIIFAVMFTQQRPTLHTVNMKGNMWNGHIFFCFLTPEEYILVLQWYVIRADFFFLIMPLNWYL
jgi:hypothetical protein